MVLLLGIASVLAVGATAYCLIEDELDRRRHLRIDRERTPQTIDLRRWEK